MAKLIPAILAHSSSEFKEKLTYLSDVFDTVQLDMMDGDFVPDTTYYNLEEIKAMNPSVLFELHMMINSPLSLVSDWVDYEQVRRVIIHKESVETREQIYDILEEVLSRNKETGLAINPNTTVEEIREFIPRLAMVLVMGGEPGQSGQSFNPLMLEKIKELRKCAPDLQISVDVGVSLDNWKDLVVAGADTLSSASMVFGLKSEHALQSLKQEIENYPS